MNSRIIFAHFSAVASSQMLRIVDVCLCQGADDDVADQ
jgi:hypothetical protein